NTCSLRLSVKPRSVEAVNVKFALKVVISAKPSLTCNDPKLNIVSNWRDVVLPGSGRRRRWELRAVRAARAGKVERAAKVAKAEKAERPHVPVLLPARAR